MMKQGIFLLLCLLVTPAWAASTSSEGIRYKSYTDIFDNDSLKRGAEAFATRCLACHSAQFVRFKRIADDLGWSEAEIQNKMIHYSKNRDGNWFTHVESPLSPELSTEIFHIVPPDLSLIARVKGTDYLLNYLLNYYQDSDARFNTNNTLLPNSSMPNVLIGLQGTQEPVRDEHGHIRGYTIIEEGTLGKKAFYNYVTDLVNFLDYMAEPAKATRMRMGWWVISFVLLVAFFAYLLKRNYWLDVKPNGTKKIGTLTTQDNPKEI